MHYLPCFAFFHFELSRLAFLAFLAILALRALSGLRESKGLLFSPLSASQLLSSDH
jgi:hypothetical protein